MTEESISGSGSTESGQRVRGRRDGTGRMGSRGRTEIGTSAEACSPALQDGHGAESRETQQTVQRYRDCAPASARLESVLWDEIRWHRRD